MVSSYVWRGTQFGTGPAVQPWFTLPSITESLELGVWGSFPLSDDAWNWSNIRARFVCFI